MGFENLSDVGSLTLIITLGIVALFSLIYLLIPLHAQEGRVLEKRKRRRGSKWVRIIFKPHYGKKKSFFVTQEQSSYIYPGESGILQKNAFGRTSYISLFSGLQAQVVGKSRFVFKWFLLYTGFALVVVVPYFFYYDHIMATWQERVVQPMWAKSSTADTGEDTEREKTSLVKEEKSPTEKVKAPKKGVEKWLAQLTHPLKAEEAFQKLRQAPQKGREKIDDLLSPYREVDPFVRTYAIRLAGEWKMKEAVPHLISLVQQGPVYQKYWANWSLEKITGRESGYEDARREKARQKALQSWKKWHEQQKKKSEKDDPGK